MAARLLMLSLLLMLMSPISSWKCGDCVCSRSTCSQYMECRNLQLTALPYPAGLEEHIPTHINISDNIIPNIQDNMFANFSQIKVVYLSLRNNSIVNISSNVFVNLAHLEGLDLSWNFVDMKQLEKSFHGIQGIVFNKLNMSHMNIRDIPDSLFNSFEMSREINISLSNNTLTTLNYKAFENLSGIVYLDLEWNQISNLSFPVNFTNKLKCLRLDYNRFNAFPNFCKNDTNSYFPELVELSFQWNIARYISPNCYTCLRKLQYLYLSGNAFSTLQNNMFADLAFIKHISLSQTFGLKHVHGSPFNNTNLLSISFRDNFLYNPYHLNFFEGCTSLMKLDLNFNFLEGSPDSEFEALFQPLTNLRYLKMGGCFLTRVPPAITKHLVKLEILDLDENKIATLSDGMFDSLTNMNYIFLRKNEITSISERTFSREFRKQLIEIGLNNNPFHCSCDLRWFADWMRNDSKRFGGPPFNSTYLCKSPEQYKDVFLKDVTFSDSICLLDLNAKIITLSGSTLLIVLMVVGLVLYRYRWYIRYLIYMLRYKHRQEVDTRQYEYDAFVAYSTENRPWVIRTLMPVLEDEAHLKLCIHDRDFEVGNLIVDNIVDSVEKSRCLIIILSNSFAQSEWCQFELALIQRHVLENAQRLLVLVMLEEIETRHVTKSIRAMLQTTTYLLWGDEEYAKKAFFNRLRLLLRKPRGRGRRLSI